MDSPSNNSINARAALPLFTLLLLLGAGAMAAGAQVPAPTQVPAAAPGPTVPATPEPTQTPTPEPTPSPTPSGTPEGPSGVADLLVLQVGNTVTAYLVDNKSGAIYSRKLAEGERGRIGLAEFKRFHSSDELDEPSGIAYRVGKLLVCDRDHDVLLEVDLATRAERVLLRKGDAGGFAAPSSVAASSRGGIAVGSAEAGKVWVRTPKAAGGAFAAIPLPRGVAPARLFFVESDLFIVSRGGEIYMLPAGEVASGDQAAMRKVPTGFVEPSDIIYHGGLLFAAGKSGVWVQAYAPAGEASPGVPPTPRASRLTTDVEHEVSRLAVTPDAVLAAAAEGTSIQILARPPAVSQLQLQGDNFYWLEPFTNAVYRMGRRERGTSAAERVWSGARLEEASGLAVNASGTIYVVDRKSPSIYSLSPDGVLSVVYTGGLLEQPTNITVGEKVLYVLDSGTRKLLSFNPTRKEVVEEYVYERGPMPDRLRYYDGNLLTFATSDIFLDRFVTAGERHAAGEGTHADWQVVGGEGHGTVRRGQRFQLRKALSGGVADFSLVENIVYFLDAEKERLVLLPLEGGEPTSVAYGALARNPTAIAADDREMFLVDGHRRRFNRAPVILPVTVDFEGKWTPLKLVNLYDYLLDQNLLTTKRVTFDNATLLETLALKTVPTGDYVVQFRALFCRLNQVVCAEWNALPAQVAQGAELIPAGRVVVVPDVRLEPYTTQRLITLPLETTRLYRAPVFRQYVNGPLGKLALEFLPDGVSPTELPQQLRELNPEYKEPDIMSATTGDFIIPIKAARVYAAAPQADVLNPQSRLSQIVKGDNVTAFSPAMMAEPQTTRSRGEAMRAVKAGTARPAPPPDSRCKPLEPGVISNAMEIINYCFPLTLLDPDNAPPPPEVGVIDNFFNPKLPIFGGEQGSTVHIYQDPNPTVEVEQIEEVKQLEEERPKDSTDFLDIDHGTHMAALIGGEEQPNEMTGFYPRAQIHAIPFTAQLSGAMTRLRTLGLFNLSLGEISGKATTGPGGVFVETQPIINVITNFPMPLIVVSAGNDAKRIRDNTLASFGYLDNVLVVGATNSPAPDQQTRRRPPVTLWLKSQEEGSSYDNELVGLVAPGEGIKSALYNGKYGVADGTSPATAMVTGAAAVLMNVESSWDAWQVKFRLIAAADLWTDRELRQNLFPRVFSGVLNMRRAVLDTKVAVADHQTNGVCRGRIPVQELDKKLKIRRPGGAEPLEIRLRHIMRVARNGDSKYTIIYYEKPRLTSGNRRINYMIRRVVDVETFDLMEGHVFQFNVSNPTANCRSGDWNLTTLKDFLNTFYPAPSEEPTP